MGNKAFISLAFYKNSPCNEWKHILKLTQGFHRYCHFISSSLSIGWPLELEDLQEYCVSSSTMTRATHVGKASNHFLTTFFLPVAWTSHKQSTHPIAGTLGMRWEITSSAPLLLIFQSMNNVLSYFIIKEEEMTVPGIVLPNHSHCGPQVLKPLWTSHIGWKAFLYFLFSITLPLSHKCQGLWLGWNIILIWKLESFVMLYYHPSIFLINSQKLLGGISSQFTQEFLRALCACKIVCCFWDLA